MDRIYWLLECCSNSTEESGSCSRVDRILLYVEKLERYCVRFRYIRKSAECQSLLSVSRVCEIVKSGKVVGTNLQAGLEINRGQKV